MNRHISHAVEAFALVLSTGEQLKHGKFPTIALKVPTGQAVGVGKLILQSL